MPLVVESVSPGVNRPALVVSVIAGSNVLIGTFVPTVAVLLENAVFDPAALYAVTADLSV